jgi:uncharacterized delta-60 repeat protein
MKNVFHSLRVLAGVGALLFASALPVFANTLDPSGDLDTGFATTGKAQFNFQTVTVPSDSRAIIRQPSGKLVIAGGSNNGIYKDYLLLRLNTNGTLDPSFGTASFGLAGVTVVDMGFDDHINGLAQNSTGSRICGGGISNFDFGVACFTTDGQLDTSFNAAGTKGFFKSNAPGSGGGGRILGMTFDRSDRLVVIGYAPGPATRDVFLHRFNTDGTDDNTFGTNGWARIDVNGGSDRGFDVAVLKGASAATDQLVAVGTNGSHPFIAVLNANGALDTSSHALTGTTGIFNPAANPQGHTIFEGVAVDSSNNIYVTGQGPSPPGGGFFVEKYNLANAAAVAQTANLGTTGNDVGMRVRIATVAGNERVYASGTTSGGTDFEVARMTLGLAIEFQTGTNLSSGSDFAYDIAVDPVTGYMTATGVTTGNANTVGVARYNPSGNLDTGFNGTGTFYAAIQGGSGDFAAAFAVQSDGKAILAGTTTNSSSDYDLLVTRLNTDGTRDTAGWASATNGWDTRGFGVGSAEQMNPGGVAIDGNGKAVVVGTSNGYFAVRYNTNGTLDTSFDTDGIVNGNWGPNSEGKVVAIDSSNNVIVGGDISLNGDFKFSRLLAASGAVDAAFGASGTATVDIAAGKSDVLKAIAIDPSGKIVAAGECFNASSFGKMCLARLNSNGSLDTSFNTTGKVFLSSLSGNDTFDIRSLQLLPDLDTPSATDYKIVVAGQFVQSSPSQAMWLSARFNMDGSLDTSFNSTGYKTLVPGFDTSTPPKPYVGSANSVALQYDEKLVVVGESAQPDPLNACCFLNRRITLARLNWDGSLDTTYGTNGFTYTSYASDPTEAYQVYVYPQSNASLKGRALLAPFIVASDFAMTRYLADPSPITGTTVAPDLVAASDTGRSSTDNITNDTTPTFTGTCSQGETVYLLVNGANTQPRTRQVCPAPVGGVSTYTLTPTSALSGVPRTTYAFSTRTQSGIGDAAAASAAINVTIDAEINPAVVITAPTAGSNVLPNPTITGTSEAVADVVITSTGGGSGCASPNLANGNVDGSGSGSWSCASTFQQGPHTVSAVQTDLSGNAASAVTRSFSVKSQTSTAISSNVNPSKYGQSVTFTATVTPVGTHDRQLTGTNIRFVEGVTTLATVALDAAGQATYTPSGLGLSVTTHTIQAVYDENTYWLASSASVDQIVQPADTTTGVSSNTNPSVFGQSVTFTATVAASAPGAGTPSGTVNFVIDGGAPVAATLNGAGVATMTTSALAVGTRTIAANYLGSTNYNASGNSLSGGQVVNKANTATAVTSSPNPSVLNQSVTFTATVTALSPGAGIPSGTVTFLDGGSSIGSGVVNGAGMATFSTSALTVGNHTITATYGSDSNFNGSAGTLAGNPQVVNKMPTTTTMTSSPNPSVFGQSVTFTATVVPTPPGTGTPTGTVTFLDNGGSIGSGVLNGSGVATFSTSALAGGNHTITASYGSDATFDVSTGPLTGNPQVVNKADATTAVVSATNPSVFNQSVTFTATLTATAPGAGTPTGSVSFVDGGSTIGSGVLNASGVATFATSALAIGNHTITTTYAGDGNFNASAGSLTGNPQVVSKADATTALTSSANPSLLNQSVTFTATITSVIVGAGTPTGTVTFLDGGSSIGSGNLNASGVATFAISTLSVGNHTITTTYPGDASFNASAGSMTGNPQVVNKIATATTLSSVTPPGPITLGTPVDVAASVAVVPSGPGTPTGTITITSTDTSTNATDTCSFSVPASTNCTLTATTAGSKTVTAAYGGDTDYATSTSSAAPLSVTPAVHTVTATAGANGSISPATLYVVDGNTGNFTVTPNGAYSAVMSTDCPEGLGTLSNNTYTTLPVSTDCTVTANFVSAASALTVTVSDSRTFARYGNLINYVVTVSNSGGSDATGLSISGSETSTGSNLDTAGGHWLCFGSAASCAASGSGDFSDANVTIPANGSVSWIVTEPVRGDAPDAALTYTITLAGITPPITQSDTDAIVIFHDSFEVSYGDGTQSIDPIIEASGPAVGWDGQSTLRFSPVTAKQAIQGLISARAADGSGFRIEQIDSRTQPWLRVVAFDAQGGERASAWTSVAPGAALVLTTTGLPSARWLIVLGGAKEIDWPIAAATWWQLQSSSQTVLTPVTR